MMGGQSSKKKGSDATPPALQMKIDSQFSADLSSYEAACTLDPDLQSFDNIIHERTSRVINTLSTGVEVRSLSFDSLKEVTGSLLDMNQEVAKVILECKKDIWNNQELFDLVEEYFESSIQILDFCNVFENCLKRARNSQLIIKLAVKQFEEEMGLQDGVDEKRYVKTLEELKKFKESWGSIHRGVLYLVSWWQLPLPAPPFVTALAGALAVPIGSVGKWCNSLWKGEEDVVKLAIDEIKKKLEVFMETIEVLCEHADKSKVIRAQNQQLQLHNFLRGLHLLKLEEIEPLDFVEDYNWNKNGKQ
ncbi:hypothetical protein Patl1_28864 [Pistacia atlantica]|uniref:Uncharacterized protein n=1 Tax=Pistacia atlantica TaxID=434234 RepID=A0ACC1BES9_9ROSI|nr:hypothetical protein Patl1_28864 [Pistacia atlantica]